MFKKKKIFLAVLNQGEIKTDLAKVLNYIQQNDSYEIMVSYPSAKPITNNRNMIVQKFLAIKDADYLMMIDADIIPTPDILNLVDFEKDIITPLMFVQQKGTLIPLYLRRNKDGIYDAGNYLEETGLQEVDATGTGCIVIKREVLEKVEHPFENVYDRDGIKKLGNDFNFCKKAKELGFKVWVHLDYVADHISEMSLREVFLDKIKQYHNDKELHQIKQVLKEKGQLDQILEEVNKLKNKDENSRHK
jgi:hypothetical protein